MITSSLRYIQSITLTFHKRHFTAISLNSLVNELNHAGHNKNNEQVVKLWQMAEANEYNKDNDCSRTFLHWFSSLGQIQYTLDVISSLIPNVTNEDTLQLLTTYKNAKDHIMAQYALQLLLDNEFDLNRDHFNILISTSANNGDLDSVIQIMDVMKSHNIEATQSTLDLIFQCLECYFLSKQYDFNKVHIHRIIDTIENKLFSLCNVLSMEVKSEYIIKFMEWYCEFGDVSNAFKLAESISFEKYALKSNICQKMAILQISLLFKNKINLSKAIGLLQNDILGLSDDLIYSFFNYDANGQIMPKLNTSRRIFNELKAMNGTNWCNVNVLNLLLHIAQISNDLHNGCYILNELYLHHRNEQKETKMSVIEPNHNTLMLISKLFALSHQNMRKIPIQPATVEWSIQIYEWLLDKYKNNEFIADLLKDITQNLLCLILHDLDNNLDNVESFGLILKNVKNVFDNFEADYKLFAFLGKQTVCDYVKLDVVIERSIKVYGCMVMQRGNGKMITSVSDRARLLGAILTNFDRNVCKMYREQIGGSKQSYFQIRRDLQQQLVLKLHRKYSLNDILTLDVLKLTQTKPINHTDAFTDDKDKVEI